MSAYPDPTALHNGEEPSRIQEMNAAHELTNRTNELENERAGVVGAIALYGEAYTQGTNADDIADRRMRAMTQKGEITSGALKSEIEPKGGYRVLIRDLEALDGLIEDTYPDDYDKRSAILYDAAAKTDLDDISKVASEKVKAIDVELKRIHAGGETHKEQEVSNIVSGLKQRTK